MERKVTLSRSVEIMFNGQPVLFPTGVHVLSEDFCERVRHKDPEAVESLETVGASQPEPAKPAAIADRKPAEKPATKPPAPKPAAGKGKPATEPVAPPPPPPPPVEPPPPAPVLTEETQPQLLEPVDPPPVVDPGEPK